MHSAGDFRAMHQVPVCPDIISVIKRYFTDRIQILLEAGVRRDQIILDPGIGFSKGWNKNMDIIKRLEEFQEFGLPIYIGLSRKKFVGKITSEDNPQKRDIASSLLHLICLQKGASYIRTHNVGYLKQTIEVYEA